MPTTTTSAVRQLSDGSGLTGAPGTQLGQAAADPVGFFGATPVVQPAAPTSHNTTGGAAGSTGAVYRDTTFTGGVGSSAFTLGDVVAALKNLGLLAQ